MSPRHVHAAAFTVLRIAHLGQAAALQVVATALEMALGRARLRRDRQQHQRCRKRDDKHSPIWLPSPLTSQVQTPTILAVANFWSRINCRTHVAIARFRVVSFDREEALPTIGLLTQTTTGADANVWDDYISAFKGALCTNGYTSPLPQQTGTDYNSYLTGAQNLMRGRPDANAN